MTERLVICHPDDEGEVCRQVDVLVARGYVEPLVVTRPTVTPGRVVVINAAELDALAKRHGLSLLPEVV